MERSASANFPLSDEINMEIDFDYDLNETVLIGGHYMSLRSAVLDQIERVNKGHPGSLRHTIWLRDRGKEPSHFEMQHIEALAKLPAFNVARPLPQRE
jgi:hypothetical protein